MKRSEQRILTTHVGSLIRPGTLLDAAKDRDPAHSGAYERELKGAVADVVSRQATAGIDVVNDGEFGKSMGHRVNYGAWMSYAYHRLGGLDLGGPDMHDVAPRRSSPASARPRSSLTRRC